MKTMVYPGSFDPITLGHLDIIKRASKMADKLIVTVMYNPEKNCYFSVDERIEMIKKCTKNIKNVEVDCFSGLMVDYMKKVGATAAVRGLRAVTDFEYELQWATFNQMLDDEFEAVFLMANTEHSFLSSSIVREIGQLGGNIKKMVSPEIYDYVNDKLNKNGIKE
ncbi:MAG: pantetheine-phosphate adenylyltransferase [Clostridiales bacterium]|nr:pantetheine-phosphate adenylyltransferase [Clostridiales bacterium]